MSRAKPSAERQKTEARTVWTVGHSNRSIEEFLELMREEQIQAVTDVRRFPGSRRHPHFNQDALKRALAQEEIAYRHFVDLGGRRSKRIPGSPNAAWRVDAFNAYADFMMTADFQAAFAELCELAASRRTAVMCSEALPWQCHRRLIADLLVARGWKVLDIIGPRSTDEHELPAFARIEGDMVIYPRETLF